MSNYSLFKTTHLYIYFFIFLSANSPHKRRRKAALPLFSFKSPPLPLSKNVSRLVSTFPFHVSRKRTSKVHYAIASLVIRRTFYMGGGYYIFFVIISCRFSLSLSFSFCSFWRENERKNGSFLGEQKKWWWSSRFSLLKARSSAIGLDQPPTSGLLRGAWLINFNETQKSDFYPLRSPMQKMFNKNGSSRWSGRFKRYLLPSPCLVNDENPEQKEIILWFQNKTKEKRK